MRVSKDNNVRLDALEPLAQRRLKPVRIDDVTDKGFAYWHSATFNNDGTKVLFTDEWGGGGRPRCQAGDPRHWGADAIYSLKDGKLSFDSLYKLPAPQSDKENCVAHNGSIIPVPGRDIFVQAWYQGGISVIDFTDADNPVEIAYFDPERIGVTGRKLGLASDARTRFERGVDPAFLDDGLALLTDLIVQTCGGTPSEAVQVGQAPVEKTDIAFDPEMTARLGGVEIARDRQRAILGPLGRPIAAGREAHPRFVLFSPNGLELHLCDAPHQAH